METIRIYNIDHIKDILVLKELMDDFLTSHEIENFKDFFVKYINLYNNNKYDLLLYLVNELNILDSENKYIAFDEVYSLR